MSERLTFNRRWSLADREGVCHLPLRANDEDAWWTPIACGEGINLPGSQTRDPVTCPDCIAARGQARRFGIGPFDQARSVSPLRVVKKEG